MTFRNVYIVLSFLAFIFLAYCLFHIKLEGTKSLNALKLDPLEEAKSIQVDKRLENGFWIIGDSRAASWDTSYLSFINADLFNLGIPGQTSRQVLERFKKDISVAIPATILLQVGINDLKCIGFLDNPNITQDCINHSIEILEICQKYDVAAIYCSIFPLGQIDLFRRTIWEPSTTDSIQKINKVLREYCFQNNILYFDSQIILGSSNDKAIKRYPYHKDFLHLNNEGYHQLSEQLRAFLL